MADDKEDYNGSGKRPEMGLSEFQRQYEQTPTPQVNANEYLQEKVMGECWEFEPYMVFSDTSRSCRNCNKSYLKHAEPRDFSTPTDYCALEDKMRELGEWSKFFIWLAKRECMWPHFIIAAHWLRHDLPQRATLIAEYWRSRDE